MLRIGTMFWSGLRGWLISFASPRRRPDATTWPGGCARRSRTRRRRRSSVSSLRRCGTRRRWRSSTSSTTRPWRSSASCSITIPNGLLLFRDELSGWLHTMDRPGHENDRAFYCEAWNGTSAYTYDRIGLGTLHIRAACVSVLGGIQPGPLERYLREVFAGRGDDGLLQRFQLAVWPDGGGRWRNVDRWPNADARARVNEVFQRLSTLEPAGLGAEELTPEELPFLRFEAAAQARFDAWRGDLEQTLRAEAEHPVWRSHVAKYRSLMPSLALIGHLIDGVDGGTTEPVSQAAAARAVAWCEYLQGHARRLYASVTDKARVAAALLAAQ